MLYQYPPLKKKLFVTINEYNRAFRFAETPEPGRDPRPMLAIIARFMEANTRISGLVRSAHDAIVGFPWDILPSDPKSEAAKKVAGEMKERFIASKLHHKFHVIIDGEFFGLTALRQVWTTVNGKMLARISVVPSTDLYRQKNADGIYEYALINNEAKFSATTIATEELQQYIFSEFNPFESTRPEFLGGLCRSAIPLTIIKNFNWQDWAQFTELFAQPFRTAEYKEGTKDEDQEKVWKALEDFGRNSYALFPENIKFQLHEAARQGTVAAYEKLLDKIDAELAILIKGEANTQELPEHGGSRAAVQILKLISDDRMWWRLKRVEQIINEQYIAVDYRLNESETDIALRPRFEFITEEREDREANARIVNDLTAAGFELDDAEVSQKTGFTVRKTRRLDDGLIRPGGPGTDED